MRTTIICFICFSIASCKKHDDNVQTTTREVPDISKQVAIIDTSVQVKTFSVSYNGYFSCSGNTSQDAYVLVTYSSKNGKDSTISFNGEEFKGTFNVNQANEYSSTVAKKSWHYILTKDSLYATLFITCGDMDVCQFRGKRN